MDLLIRRATILDPSSPFHRQTTDIFIQNGYIADVGHIEASADRSIEAEGLHLSPGWVDIFAHFCDPGQEYCETVETGAAAAAAGGFTDVFLLPNTQPVVHNKAAVEYLVSKSHQLAVRLHPLGAITKNAEGKELAEMYDMHQSGAIAFSDGLQSIQSGGLLLKALQYLRAIDKWMIQLPADASLGGTGLMHEGVVSTSLGLPGKPAVAEELMIMRDLELARYAAGKIHITGLSTARSLQLIREAKSQGINVTCSVTPYHLFFTDEDLKGYDTNLKLNPPLRTAADREALRKGLEDGSIDCIATHHLPRHSDHKIIEFEYAKDGMTGLETAFAAIHTALPHLPPEKLIEKLTAARKIFNLPETSIRKGAAACISLFLPEQTWKVESFHSKSANSAFKGLELRGKPLGIINQQQLILNV